MPNTTGSFASILGGADALKSAMASRGVDTSILNQQTPASAGFNPASVMPSPVTQQGTVTQNSASLVPPVTPSTNQTNVSQGSGSSGETELILKALTKRLDTLSKAGM